MDAAKRLYKSKGLWAVIGLLVVVIECVRFGTSYGWGVVVWHLWPAMFGYRYITEWFDAQDAPTPPSPIPAGMVRVTVDGTAYDVPPNTEELDAIGRLVALIRSARLP